MHARRSVDLDSLAKVEESGKTVDLPPATADEQATSLNGPFMWVVAGLVVSVILNLILLAMLFRK